MQFAPVHPADLNTVEGVYGRQPALPATPGNEGCGIVEKTGERVDTFSRGDLVTPLVPAGCWSHRIVVRVDQLFKVPAGLDPVQAAMLRINPLTAWHLLKHFVQLPSGSGVVQNCANSAVGRCVIQLARQFGIRTINFARRGDVLPQLKTIGADECFTDDEDGLNEARHLLGEQPLKLALNGVGGDSALRLMDLLSPGGTLVTYGAMSRRSLKVPNKFLIFKDIALRGCWVTRWIETSPREEVLVAMSQLATLMELGQLRIPVDQIFPLDRWQDAITRAQNAGRHGKILLDLRD